MSTALFGAVLPASADTTGSACVLPTPAVSVPSLPPVTLPVVLPTITVTVPGLPKPVKIPRAPRPTVTITGPPVYFYRTLTRTQYVPGPVQTVRVPQPVSTVTIVKPAPTVTKAVTLPANTVTVTSTGQVPHASVKIVTQAPHNTLKYITISVPRAVGISIALVLLGAILALLALYIVYRIGQSEGWKAGERKGLLDAKRILGRG